MAYVPRERFKDWKQLPQDNRNHGPDYQTYTEMCMSCFENSYDVRWCPANSLKAQIDREATEAKLDRLMKDLHTTWGTGWEKYR